MYLTAKNLRSLTRRDGPRHISQASQPPDRFKETPNYPRAGQREVGARASLNCCKLQRVKSEQ